VVQGLLVIKVRKVIQAQQEHQAIQVSQVTQAHQVILEHQVIQVQMELVVVAVQDHQFIFLLQVIIPHLKVHQQVITRLLIGKYLVMEAAAVHLLIQVITVRRAITAHPVTAAGKATRAAKEIQAALV
jgi:hypothetical protein